MADLTLQSLAIAINAHTPKDSKSYRSRPAELPQHPVDKSRLEPNPLDQAPQGAPATWKPRNIEAIAFPVSVLADLLRQCLDKQYTHFAVFFDYSNRLNRDEPGVSPGPVIPIPPVPLTPWHGVTLAPFPTPINVSLLDNNKVLQRAVDALDPLDDCYSGGTPIPPPPP